MKTNLNLLLAILLLSFTATSCFNTIFEYGNGEIIEEQRSVPQFSSVSSDGSFDIYYEYADTPSVLVSCESNLMQYIETAVFDGDLKIGTPNFVVIRPRKTIEVYVKGPQVDKILLSGSGLIHTDTIRTSDLTLRISGSGDIETIFIGKNLSTTISGSGDIRSYIECEKYEVVISGSGKIFPQGWADKSIYTISGSGNVRGYDFPVLDAIVNISGSGDLYLNVEENLGVNISGSGNVYYIGHPNIERNISGSGNIINDN